MCTAVGWLLEMRQNSGPSIYLLCALRFCLLFFFFSKEQLSNHTAGYCVSLDMSPCATVCYMCLPVRDYILGSWLQLRCPVQNPTAITNEQRVEKKTYERKAEQRSDSLSGWWRSVL